MNTRLEEQLHTISGLSNAFFAVYWVDLRSILKSIPFFQQAVQDCRTTNGITQAFITLCVQPEDQEKMRVFMDRQRLGALLEKNDLTVDESTARWKCRSGAGPVGLPSPGTET